MSKRFSQALLIPTISLLPLIQSTAMPRNNHPEIPPSQVRAPIRDMVVRGQMLAGNTIQINKAELAKLNQHDAIRVITLLDDHGNKQRFVLLTPNRSSLVKALMEHHGHLKEFRFYSVRDENGNNINLLASKRIITAPANQLTAVFDSAQDSQNFFNNPQIKALLKKESLVFPGGQHDESASEEQTEISNEISKINQKVSQGHDQSKTTIVEPIHLFPMAVVLAIPVIKAVAPPHQ